MANLGFNIRPQTISGGAIVVRVKMLNLLAHDPVGHWVDIAPAYAAPDPVGFHQRCAAPHERVGDMPPRQMVAFVKGFAQRLINKFRQDEPSEDRAWPPGKPLVDRDRRTVILLDLLLPQGKIGNKGHIETCLNHEHTRR